MVLSGAFRLKRRALALGVLAALAAGCAYEIRGGAQVLHPGGLEAVRKIAVAPYVYLHDWTGQFRDIYRRAGILALKGQKRERIEGTFLLENHAAARGYALVPWPVPDKKLPAPLPDRIAEVRKILERLRAAGAGGVLVAAGESGCQTIEYCHARLKIVLLDTGEGRILWRSETQAGTLLSQGDEMAALIRDAIESLPEGRPGGGVLR
ncbi:MAG: hypothetical protein O2807_09100 [bacterium]|nr:hypothetical protein [bacterium]